MGKPVIATKVGGIPEAVVDEQQACWFRREIPLHSRLRSCGSPGIRHSPSGWAKPGASSTARASRSSAWSRSTSTSSSACWTPAARAAPRRAPFERGRRPRSASALAVGTAAGLSSNGWSQPRGRRRGRCRALVPTLSGTAVGGSRGVSARVWTREAATGARSACGWPARRGGMSYGSLRAVLSSHEKARADRCRLERDRRHFHLGRAC